MTVWFEIPVWPCDRGEEVAYLLLLGSYPGTESAKPKDATEGQQFSDGEGRIHFARGLELGLQGKMLDILSGKFRPDAVAVMAGTDRVFAKLLGAWIARRDDPTAVYRGFELAVKYRASDVLPAARTVAGDKDRGGEVRCAALAAVAQFGAPADLPLFAPLFDDATQMVIAPSPVPQGMGPRSRRPKVHDRAIALALLLCDRDPAEFGFVYAKGRFRRENGRPVVANYEAEAFGFPDAKARETAHAKAKEFLATQLKKDEPKKADPPAKGAKLWPRFAKTIGDDADSRALFDLIVANPKNLELLETVTEKPDAAGKLYHDRWQELNKAARIPTGDVGSHTLEQAPLAEALGWMYLGTFAGAESSFHQSYSLDFLPHMPPARTAREELRDAIKDKALSAPLRRLMGKWTAARVDYTGRDFGLQMALAYDIREVLPAARTMLTTKVKDDPYPGNTARNLGFAMLVVGKLGAKDDLPLLERYAKDQGVCARVLNDPPPKPGEPRLHLIRPPIEGQDATAQLRDVSAVMRLHLSGQKPHEFGFHWGRPFDPDKGKPWVKPDDVFNLHGIGFLRDADREAAHKKAKEWFDRQNEEPKKDTPEAAKLVEQLGSADFAEREAAAKELRKLGAKAEAALKAGLKSESAEVRDRCAKVLAEIRKDALDAFVKNFDPKAEVMPDHPIWTRFKAVAGDSRAGRELFARVIADPRLARLLDSAEANPADRARIYREEVAWRSCDALYAVANQMPGGYRMIEGGPKAAELKPPPEPITDARIAAYFLLGSYPETAVDVEGKDRAGRTVREGIIVETFEFAKSSEEPVRPVVWKLFGAWLDRRVDRDTLESGYWRATSSAIPDAVPAARRLLAAEKLPVEAKAYAALYLARCGKTDDAALIAPLLDNETVARPVIYDKPAPVQVRDAALAACLHLHGENPADYGFDVLRKRGSPKADAFDMAWLGFWTDESRTATHTKARAWLDKQKGKDDPAKLVEQLGAEDFAAREAAEKKLKELGAKVKPAVQAGLKSENPEVARRCRAVLDHLRAEEVKAAFLKLAGDDDLARSLLTEVLKDAHRARVLGEAVDHPERSGKLYAAEQWRLWQKAVSTPAGAKEADIPTAPEIALSFFLGSHSSSADSLKTEPPPNDSRISEGRRATESGLLCKSLQLELIDPKRRAPYARLMAGWLAARSDPWLVSLGLSESRQYRLPEVVPVARQVARNATIDAQHRAVAALALADLGGAAELPTLRAMMDDKTEWSRVREGRDPDGPTLTVQLRDVAVGAVLLLSGQDPGEFGFPAFRDPGTAELKPHEKLSGRCFAFTSDADREAAHKAARAWLDKQKK
jgi:hypothetical protein